MLERDRGLRLRRRRPAVGLEYRYLRYFHTPYIPFRGVAIANRACSTKQACFQHAYDQLVEMKNRARRLP